MSHAALTVKYRPQTFAQVAGQETIKTILSRASLERRVAPAYLFSGTRGVGKTTLARIFAKALNCRSAPVPEPCNICDQCRAITAGSAVDVVEIDGASNRGIDDVRRLKEVVGYAPMEGGYKIFIIDEAHMLSREAFNALLKTLEEPPARVTFIMATTEPHKFPATIISRCQHFVFKPLPESGLVSHLSRVLAAEGIACEESALRLIARRGAGSVRDSMSLLGQVLALGDDGLSETSARAVLGLAGQEVFFLLLDAVRDGDGAALGALVRDMLAQGLDIGFFLRELASLWRNLFMLRQSGEGALGVVDLPESEARRYLESSRDFSLQHIHACWQMTLEGQRRVLTSLEPALALELLLLNIGMLPRLLSLENLSALNRKASAVSFPSGEGTAGRSAVSACARAGEASVRVAATRGSARIAACARAEDESAASAADHPQALPARVEAASSGAPENAAPESAPARAKAAPHEVQEADGRGVAPVPAPENEAGAGASLNVAAGNKPESEEPEHASRIRAEPAWEDIFALCEAKDVPSWFVSLLRRLDARWKKGELFLEAQDSFTLERLNEPSIRDRFEEMLRGWCGAVPSYALAAPRVFRKSREELKNEILRHPLVREVQERCGGCVIDCGRM